ncbi:hypothetical protein [Porphyromonas sp. COT-290 OH3588]|uniref:hypothetical protein n=1 Tax=Porphyromonas sp. COT-290 OH3588 TaxID=1515617 RepID=UPI000B2E45A0|nr:hypothetical protein [Porphyromonas sp. COT-290 OH3588]
MRSDAIQSFLEGKYAVWRFFPWLKSNPSINTQKRKQMYKIQRQCTQQIVCPSTAE